MKSIVDYTNKLKDYFATNSALTTTQGSIAPVEDGTNYSQTYYKGDEFYRNGVLYKVTASSVNSSTAINTASGGNATPANSITKQMIRNVSSSFSVANIFSAKALNAYLINEKILYFSFYGYCDENHTVPVGEEHLFTSSEYNSNTLINACRIIGVANTSASSDTTPATIIVGADSTGLQISNALSGKKYLLIDGIFVLL